MRRAADCWRTTWPSALQSWVVTWLASATAGTTTVKLSWAGLGYTVTSAAARAAAIARGEAVLNCRLKRPAIVACASVGLTLKA